MSKLPDWMGALPELSSLYMEYVPLSAWPPGGFKSLQRLEIVVCEEPMVRRNLKPVAQTVYHPHACTLELTWP